MRTPAPLITALALGVLVTPALSAQTPTDLADVCKALGNAKVGQWASFEGTSSSGGGKLRLAVVGSERASDSTLYWFEVNFAGQEPGKSGVVQILAPNLASGSAAPRSLVVKIGAQPAMRISGEMAGMMGQKPGQDNAAFDWASRCSGAHVVGWESVTVPAGTFRALHVTTDDAGEVWATRDVPFGLVKLHGKQGDLVLAARGTDAKSSITEKPLDMGGMMTKP
ncbi:MAG TPA: hypothetical protein VIV88_16545 [Gemmatimonadales bacterium]|jgi:hypothetical protein